MDDLNRIRFWTRNLYRRAVQEVASRFYINPEADPRKSILVAGTARSGTTWLGDLIASQIPSRILFEPFNPDLVPEYRKFHYFQYMRSGTENPKFGAFARKVFTGEIRANLALKWLENYCREQNIENEKVWQMLRRQLWLYDNSSLSKI